MSTFPKAYATFSGCSLASNTCDGAGKDIFAVSKVVVDMSSKLGGSLPSCPGTTNFNGVCVGVAGVNPILYGDTQSYATSQKSWGLGLSPASGMCYKVTGSSGKVAYLAIINRCSGMCSCPSRVASTGVSNCASCIGSNYYRDLVTDLKPNCQCVGTASNAIGACGTDTKCDWCAANNHPHFNLNQESFVHLCGDTTAGRCELTKVEVVPNCVTVDTYWK